MLEDLPSNRDVARLTDRLLREAGADRRKPRAQRTPKGAEIPVPKKREVLDALRKAAQPKSGKPANEGQGKGKA